LVHGQEPSHLGRNAPEIKHLFERSNLGMLAHAWWPAREATPDSLLDQSVGLLELNARSTVCWPPESGQSVTSGSRATTIFCA